MTGRLSIERNDWQECRGAIPSADPSAIGVMVSTTPQPANTRVDHSLHREPYAAFDPIVRPSCAADRSSSRDKRTKPTTFLIS
ncbi:hypothetical protein RHSP_83519 [Rhizobium freirei PRF 81]|uniref:Uncharacterized protein n=2 Tax=Rhizobium TaxID=379 RepID=N6UDY2_9HYPH|nr:hypothetical protein RTCIAT899_PB01080 [Rhizobium tropici CIAT 899]AYG70419.1 hypothetical protein CCGE531_30740 [Rhizobium sp. CCGE531]AYG76958.1 hypothetical protein CCGE532_31230 [Rhizobium sp. CCGE532]ENN88368.1 hypothetical protein RHSP_83519 [Rhizobium freirei PRF 81]NEV13935.1 hypothetical protein [Rhizobium tropici]TGE92786.1 hypothetical protein C9417_27970 [Rhizobium sp. SEMIA 4088]